MPWDRVGPHPLLAEWAESRSLERWRPAGRRRRCRARRRRRVPRLVAASRPRRSTSPRQRSRSRGSVHPGPPSTTAWPICSTCRWGGVAPSTWSSRSSRCRPCRILPRRGCGRCRRLPGRRRRHAAAGGLPVRRLRPQPTRDRPGHSPVLSPARAGRDRTRIRGAWRSCPAHSGGRSTASGATVPRVRAAIRLWRMCRNIRPLNNFEPPATRSEVHDAALQYVRKIAGTTKPSKANEEAFNAAVHDIAHATQHLLDHLTNNGTAQEPRGGGGQRRGHAPPSASRRPDGWRSRRHPALRGVHRGRAGRQPGGRRARRSRTHRRRHARHRRTVWATPRPRSSPSLWTTTAEPSVRYFAPLQEVPFCGHATIATSVALVERGAPPDFELSTQAGAVRVHTERTAGGISAELTSVPPEVTDADPALVADALEALRWSADDLDHDYPPAIADAGARHLVLITRTRERLADLDYDFDRLAAVDACPRADHLATGLAGVAGALPRPEPVRRQRRGGGPRHRSGRRGPRWLSPALPLSTDDTSSPSLRASTWAPRANSSCASCPASPVSACAATPLRSPTEPAPESPTGVQRAAFFVTGG